MSFGLSASGFLRMRESDIKAALEESMVAEFGEINLGPDSVFGQIIGVFAAQLAEGWEAMEAIYHSQFPASAEGVALDNVASLNGVTRIPASPTQVIVSLIGDEGTVVPAGTKVSAVSTGDLFAMDLSKTITRGEVVRATVTVDDVASTTLYRVEIDGVNTDFTSDASATDLEIAAGLVLNINSNGLVNTKVLAVDLLDGSFRLDAADLETAFAVDVDPQLADGSERLSLSILHTPNLFESEENGPILALTGTLTEIETPVTGLDATTNLTDGDLGRLDETDTELRIRRLLALRTGGKATLAAILGALLTEVTGVSQAKVFENRTDLADVDGRPPHSFEAVVDCLDTAVQDVAQKIWDTKPAGIQTYGNVNANGTTDPDGDGTGIEITDSNGDQQTIHFSRPDEQDIYVRVEITEYAEEDFPDNGTELVKAAVLEFGNTHTIDKNVILQRFFGPIYSVEGIYVADVFIKEGSMPAGNPGVDQVNLDINDREVAKFDSANIEVVVIP